MQKKILSRVLNVLLVPLVAASLASCGKTSSEGERGAKFLDYQSINKEYQESLAKLEWPEGFTPPPDLVEEAEDGNFQTGYGDTRASLQYECAWEKEWLNTYASDAERAAKAMTHLDKIPTMGYMNEPRADKSVRNYYKEQLDRAKLGDPSGIRENVTLNCPK